VFAMTNGEESETRRERDGFRIRSGMGELGERNGGEGEGYATRPPDASASPFEASSMTAEYDLGIKTRREREGYALSLRYKSVTKVFGTKSKILRQNPS
jgi:hypothetical protein